MRVGLSVHSGLLSEIVMTGHVSTVHGRRGENAVCAAVTAVVRSCAEAVAGCPGVEASGSAPAEGEFRLRIDGVTPEYREWLRGVTDVLTGGLRRISGEAPEEVELEER